mgnify:CR=1 FL=1
MYHWMTQAEIQRFLAHLRREERSPGTLAKYRRDLLAFAARLPQGGRVDKEQVLAWKEEMARRYPQYEFERHKGYPTKLHYELIAQYGIQPFYRRSFLKKQGYWHD